MKKIILFNALFYLSVLYGQSWTNYQLVAANTAANAPGLSQEEKNVFLYLNLVRLYPSDFARIELKNHFGDRYNSGSLNWYESGLKSRLLSMSPLRAITFNSEMYQLAKCFSNEKARLGTTGHNRVNCTSGYSGECCSYGYSSGRRIILQLLIDDGVSSLGHREICLSTNYNSLGASINTHKSNSNCCVLDFTGRYGTDYSSSVVPSISSASPFTANSLSTNSYDPQVEISELRNKVNQLKSEVAEKEGIISNLNSEISTLKSNYYQLDAAKTNLNNNVYNLQQQQIQKDAQYNKLKDEFNMLSDRRTSVRRSKFNADEFHSFTFKIGLNTFYPSINPVSLGKFNSDYFSFGAETMIGFNFGDSYRRNSIGLTLRVNQTNRFLTKAIDSTSLQPKQYYDAEFTSIIREWLSIGIGGTIISDYGSNAYNVLPSGSIGLCFGPKNWKIQLTQQTAMDSNYKILGRASIGIALRL